MRCGCVKSLIHNTTPLHPLLRQIRRSRAFRRRGTCVRLRPLPLRRVAGEVDEKDFTRLRGREACSPAFGQAHGRRRDLSLARVDRLAGTGAARSQLVREGGRRVHARHSARVVNVNRGAHVLATLGQPQGQVTIHIHTWRLA